MVRVMALKVGDLKVGDSNVQCVLKIVIGMRPVKLIGINVCETTILTFKMCSVFKTIFLDSTQISPGASAFLKLQQRCSLEFDIMLRTYIG